MPVKLLAVVILLYTSLTYPAYTQIYKKTATLNPVELCIYKYLINANIITNAKQLTDSFYILQKDSLFMFQFKMNKSDTQRTQIHLVSKTDNNQTVCAFKDWKINKVEFIEKGKYRGNPVFYYQQYFDAFDPFNSDYASVKVNGKWGFINSFGEMIIPAAYEKMQPHFFGIWVKGENGTFIQSLKENRRTALFDNIGLTAPRIDPYDISLSIVKKGGKMGMLNSELKVLIPIIYDDIRLLSQRFLVGNRQNKFVLISPITGKEITQLYDKIRMSIDNKSLETAIQINDKLVISKIDYNGKTVEY